MIEAVRRSRFRPYGSPRIHGPLGFFGAFGFPRSVLKGKYGILKLHGGTSMSQPPAGNATAPPATIYIIRHGEKPADPPAAAPGQSPPAPTPPFGIDFQGNQDPHSLLPRGWQRSGAASPPYAFGQVPQQLLAGDANTIIQP